MAKEFAELARSRTPMDLPSESPAKAEAPSRTCGRTGTHGRTAPFDTVEINPETKIGADQAPVDPRLTASLVPHAVDRDGGTSSQFAASLKAVNRRLTKPPSLNARFAIDVSRWLSTARTAVARAISSNWGARWSPRRCQCEIAARGRSLGLRAHWLAAPLAAPSPLSVIPAAGR